MANPLEANSPDRCCLCGSPDDLTGEHKVKASAIRSLFSGEPMMIGTFDGESRPRRAQSSTSKAFHFRSRICAQCNSARTQRADVEFTRFDATARALLEAGFDPIGAFDDPRYALGSGPYLDVFRYLAKVLACHVADVDGPRIAALTDFAIGRTDRNPVSVAMDADPKYRFWYEGTADAEYAAHGGLMTTFSQRTGLTKSLGSTLTHGPLRYAFGISFGWGVGLALRLLHPTFHALCERARDAAAAEAELAASGQV